MYPTIKDIRNVCSVLSGVYYITLVAADNITKLWTWDLNSVDESKKKDIIPDWLDNLRVRSIDISLRTMYIHLATITNTDPYINVTTMISDTLNDYEKLRKRKEKLYTVNKFTEQYEAEFKESGVSKSQFIKSLQMIQKKVGYLSFNGVVDSNILDENVDELEAEIKGLSELVEKGTNEIRKLGGNKYASKTHA